MLVGWSVKAQVILLPASTVRRLVMSAAGAAVVALGPPPDLAHTPAGGEPWHVPAGPVGNDG